MNWIRAHPYIASVLGAVLLLLIGVIVIAQRADVQPQGELRAWGGIGANLFDSSSSGNQNFDTSLNNIYKEVQSGPPFHYNPTSGEVPLTQGEGSDGFDFAAFLELLSESGNVATSEGVPEYSGAFDVYSLIPQGLISTSTFATQRTPLQQELYRYGNEAGSIIQEFEGQYQNSSQLLKDQFEDRYNVQKGEAVLSLAAAMTQTGGLLGAMEDVPSEIRGAHEKVAASYREMGAALSKVPEAKLDQDMLTAMLAYNTTVETYVKNYVSLATLLSAYGVTFSTYDAGVVFTFTNVSL